MLSALQPSWGAAASVAWVVMAQGVAGIAKDLTKTASKSAIKAASTEDMGQLFRWVAWFTGSKNATKGAGFFIGGFLLQAVGFRPALWLMAGMLALVLIGALLLLPRTLGKAKSSKTFRELFAKTRAINLIAAARVFMFGSRDVWFVVGLPVYPVRLRLALHAGGRLRRRLDHRLRRGAGAGPRDDHAQPRRTEHGGPGGAAVGRHPDGHSGGARRAAGHAGRAAA